VTAFVSDLNNWTADLKQESAADEPAPLRPRNNAAPIRNVPTTTIHNAGPAKPRAKGAEDKDDNTSRGDKGRMPTMQDFARVRPLVRVECS
jgi:hypothetical protein